MASIEDYENLSSVLEGRSGRFVDEVKALDDAGLEHLDGVFSLIDPSHAPFDDWIEEEFQSVISELDLLYLCHSVFDTVEINKSPSGTEKNADIYFEDEGISVWLEVKTPRVLPEYSGPRMGLAQYTPQKVYDYIRDEKFRKLSSLSSEEDVIVLGIGELIPFQRGEFQSEFPDLAPSAAEYVDGVFWYWQHRKPVSFGCEFFPLTKDGARATSAFEKIRDFTSSA